VVYRDSVIVLCRWIWYRVLCFCIVFCLGCCRCLIAVGGEKWIFWFFIRGEVVGWIVGACDGLVRAEVVHCSLLYGTVY
jgi:hypothetical protein